MKKLMLSAALLGVILHAPVQADEMESVNHAQELKGPALGALIGGALAGPPGVMAGLISGVFIGHVDQQEEQIQQTGEALALANEKAELLVQQQAQEHARMLRQVQENHLRLQAVADGFSFCLGFRTESATIEPAVQPHLEALAGMLNAFSELNVEVRASADRRGSDNYNLELTKLRAEAVVQRLVEAGVAADRIKMHLGGEAAAVYPETDLEGLGFDRYVVLSFIRGDAS